MKATVPTSFDGSSTYINASWKLGSNFYPTAFILATSYLLKTYWSNLCVITTPILKVYLYDKLPS